MSNNFRCSFCNRILDKNSIFLKSANSKQYLCEECCLNSAILVESLLQNSKNVVSILKYSEHENKNLEDFVYSMQEIAALKKESELNQIFNPDTKKTITRSYVYNEVKKIIKGQDENLRTLISAIFRNQLIDLPNYKNNILIVGNTGVGKTESIMQILKLLDISFCICDASKYSETGYIGKDIDSSVEDLYKASGKNKEKTERGVIVIDEFDKLKECSGAGRDVSGSSVQEELLTLMNGTKVTVDGSKSIDTSFITFILMGAFDSNTPEEKLRNIREKRLGTDKQLIGFSKVENLSKFEEKKNEFKFLTYTSEDFSTYGIISQITGRCPVILEFNDLSFNILMDILKNSSISKLAYYTNYLLRYNVKVEITDDTLEEICNQALLDKTGARGLNRFLELLFSDVTKKIEFDLDEGIVYSKCKLTKETLYDSKNYTLIKCRNKKTIENVIKRNSISI